jgi:RHS repeat-associated protein
MSKKRGSGPTATNANGTVTRTYNREGTLKTERQVVGAADFTQRYWYDTGNRRTAHNNGNDSIAYTYGADGLLAKLKVSWQGAVATPDSFLFYWDGLGRRDSVVYSNQTYVSLGYDRDGHMRMLCSRHPSNSNVVDVLEYRLRHANLTPEGHPLRTTRDAGGTGSPGCGSIPSGPYTSDPAFYEYDARHQARRAGGWRYDYDASGNRLATRFVTGSLLDSTTYRTKGNQVYQTYDATPSLQKTFIYDSNGWLLREQHQSPSGNWRRYYYNTIGQMVWYESLELVTGPGGPSNQWVGTTDCEYDALGRRVYPCGAVGVGTMGFDGDTPIRGMGGYATPIWRWIHGPSVDDPLVALNQVGAGNYTKYFYLTDGRGRNLAFTDVNGNDKSTDLVYIQNGGTQSGAIDRSGSFENGRSESPQAPHLAFYRNRYYDQSTGRFTQEDPIGYAGGSNLYGYAGNNPVVFTDPFGLCPPEDQNEDDCQTDSKGTQKESFCPAGSHGTPPNCTSVATRQPSPGSCPNVGAQEWDLGQQAITTTVQDPQRNEAGFYVTGSGAFPMVGPGFVITAGTIGPVGGWPQGTHTMVHSHPSGRGISPGDIRGTDADGVRTVSAGVGTNRYGSYSKGGTAVTCNMPNRPATP